MSTEYYPYCIHLNNRKLFVVWCTDDYDYLLLSEQGMVCTFHSLSDLQSFAQKKGFALFDDNIAELNLDQLRQWLESPSRTNIDPVLCLNAWNLFTDFRSAQNQRNMNLEDKEHLELYNKVFFANNLPSMTPPGSSFNPKWSKSEVKQLHTILEDGINSFQAHINP